MILRVVNCKFSVEQAKEMYHADPKSYLYVSYNYAVGCLKSVGFEYEEAKELCNSVIRKTTFKNALKNLWELIETAKS